VIGLIAQEVYRVLPEVVHEDENGLLSVNYSELVPVLISAFNEHVENEEAYKEAISNDLDELRKCTHWLSATEDSRKITDQSVVEKLTQLASLVQIMKLKIDKRKNTPKPLRIIRNMSWAQWAAFWGCVVVVFAIAATIGIWMDIRSRTTPNTPQNNEWSDNLLANPSFEFVSIVGNMAIHWIPRLYGYSLITDMGAGQYELTASMDTVIDPVTPHTGSVALRLGSTMQPVGDTREYQAYQRLLITDNVPPNWSYVNVSAWCNPTYTGVSTSTHFYISLEPLFSTNTSIPWETRLFFTFEFPGWEYEEQVVEFTDSDVLYIIGFEVAIHLVTKEDAILYCDDIKLLMK